jgi:putative hydrolase of the HAD superfamily
MRPQALLLDLDDTLLDTRQGTRLALRDFHGTHGHLMGVGLEEAEDRWERGIKVHFPRYVRGEISFQDQRRGRVREIFAKPDLTDAASDALFETYLRHYGSHYILFDDVLEYLDGLAGLPVAIVTNGSADHQLLKVRATGLSERVKTLVISEAVGLRKPQREIFLYAARELGADPAGCLMVGDNFEVDCLGALAAGMTAVWMDRFGDGRKPEGADAVRTVKGLRELRNLGMGGAPFATSP